MHNTAAATRVPALLLAAALSAPSSAAVCQGSVAGNVAASDATAASVASFVRAKGMTVLTFVGFSGAGYEDPAAMLAHAAQVLTGQQPDKTMINIGATASGIGAVYELAKRQGFTTIGIVSTLARDEHAVLSPCVDTVFYIRDSRWGGREPDSQRLSPTSAAIVANSRTLVAIGGGDIARDELLAARRAGKQASFVAADMNHQIARDKALKSGLPEPTDFRGSAHTAWAGGR